MGDIDCSRGLVLFQMKGIIFIKFLENVKRPVYMCGYCKANFNEKTTVLRHQRKIHKAKSYSIVLVKKKSACPDAERLKKVCCMKGILLNLKISFNDFN